MISLPAILPVTTSAVQTSSLLAETKPAVFQKTMAQSPAKTDYLLQLEQERHMTICKNTFFGMLAESDNILGHSIDWALLLDTGEAEEDRTMLMTVFKDDSPFSPEIEQVTTMEGKKLKVIGMIEDGCVRFVCDNEHLKTYFTEAGTSWLHGVLVEVGQPLRKGQEREQKAIDNEESDTAQMKNKKATVKHQAAKPRRNTRKRPHRNTTQPKQELTRGRLRELQLAVEVKDLQQAAQAYYGEEFANLHTTVVENLKSEAGIALVKEALKNGDILVTRKHGPDGGPVQFLRTLPEHLPEQWKTLA